MGTGEWTTNKKLFLGTKLAYGKGDIAYALKLAALM